VGEGRAKLGAAPESEYGPWLRATSNRPWADKRRGRLGEEMSNLAYGEGSRGGFFQPATRPRAAPPTRKESHFGKESVWTKAKNVHFAPNGDFPNGM
jgi:hypothetical protein